ncbi:MAG: Clp protease N-terminal domain-containing protein [Acidimicrobiales bacterium]
MARALAGEGRVGSHHLLLALLDDERSLAAKVLASLGVTSEAAEQGVDEIGVAGTSDETPEEAGARRMQVRVTGDRLEIFIDDPAVVQGLPEVVVSGTDPAAAQFPELWSAVRATAQDLARRLDAEPEWRAEGWGDQTLAGYVVRVGPEGLAARLTLSSAEVDEAHIRHLLASWAETMQGSFPNPERECRSFSVVADRSDEGKLEVGRFHVSGTAGGEGVIGRPLRDLLAFAVDDLRQQS